MIGISQIVEISKYSKEIVYGLLFKNNTGRGTQEQSS